MDRKKQQEALEALRKKAAAVAEPIHEMLLRDIVRRVRGAGGITSTAEYQIYRAEQLGLAEKEIKRAIAEQLALSDEAIDLLFEDMAGLTAEFEENAQLQQLVEAYSIVSRRTAAEDFENLWAPGPDKKLYTVKEAYGKIMDFAFMQTATGAADFQSAVRASLKELVRRGIRVIPREGGGSMRIEAAVRQYIVNRMGEMHNAISKMNYDAIGADGWEISAHAAPAPDHAPYQGHQYPAEEYERINNGLRRRFGWWGCMHTVYPILLGISPPAYSSEQLQQYLDDNEAGVWYQGKHYTLYEAKGRKRELESLISSKKYDVMAAEGDAEWLRTEQIRLANIRQEYNRFCKATGQTPEPWRTMTAEYGRSRASRDAWAARKLGITGRSAGKPFSAGGKDYLPIRVGQIDFDREKLLKELALRSKSLEGLEHEEDITITTDGTIWQTIGTETEVHAEWIETQYHVSLRGSYSYHNHPAKETYYSFSANDVEFFFRYGVQYQQASDDVYEYVMERTPDTVVPKDAEAEFDRIFRTEVYTCAFEDERWNIDENGYDLVLQRLAEVYNFKYERRRKG